MIKTRQANISISAVVNAPVKQVWNLWILPNHIIHWNNASDDWYTPVAENDLREGGRFRYRMEARDGSSGFDFSGLYRKVKEFSEIEYILDDGREVMVSFTPNGKGTLVTERFEPENENPVEMQRDGWQSILDNFKKYVESYDRFETLHFEISINREVEKVYAAMLGEETYPEWTAAFNPTSRFTGNWEKNSKMLFMGEDGDGNVGGMVSRVKENIPNSFVSVEHYGIIENGQEVTSGPQIDLWGGAIESYGFSEKDGKTLVTVDMDSIKEFKTYFEETWPRALKLLKEICEK